MKAFPIFFLATAGLCFGQSGDYLNFLRQTTMDDLLVIDHSIDGEGSASPLVTIGELGSLFELWTLDTTTGSELKLDELFVSSYTPKIELVVETADPYPHCPRIRVDQPVVIRLSSVSATDGTTGKVPKMVEALLLTHTGYRYPEGAFSLQEAGGLEAQFENEYATDDAGTITLEFPASNLVGENLAGAKGIEVFTVSPLFENNGHGNNVETTDSSNPNVIKSGELVPVTDLETFQGGKYVVGGLIEEATLQVWPMPEATISGVDSTTIYREVPPVTINLKNLYPDSATYAQVYEGTPGNRLGEPVVVNTACAIIRDSIPQDRTIVIENLGEFMGDSGSYTLEVLHDTPFGTDVIAQVTPIQVHWSVLVRGTLFSDER